MTEFWPEKRSKRSLALSRNEKKKHLKVCWIAHFFGAYVSLAPANEIQHHLACQILRSPCLGFQPSNTPAQEVKVTSFERKFLNKLLYRVWNTVVGGAGSESAISAAFNRWQQCREGHAHAPLVQRVHAPRMGKKSGEREKKAGKGRQIRLNSSSAGGSSHCHNLHALVRRVYRRGACTHCSESRYINMMLSLSINSRASPLGGARTWMAPRWTVPTTYLRIGGA